MESSNQSSPIRQADVYVDLTLYVGELRDEWRLIAEIVFVVALATALYDHFLATRWYHSTAILRPISTSVVEGRITGSLGGLGGGAVGEMGGLAATLGTGSNDADEYTAIVGGFSFNNTLWKRHQLAAELFEASWLQRIVYYFFPTNSTNRDWRAYGILLDRFDCGYSHSTGNMQLAFTASSPKEAEQILGYYIDDLRDLLRARSIRDAAAAIASLREEALSTSDPLMRSELYSLEAKQVERKKIAEVEADFAFRVLDRPAAPDKKYSPRTLLDCMVAGLLAAFATAGLILRRFSLRQRESRINVPLRSVGIPSRKIDPAGGSS